MTPLDEDRRIAALQALDLLDTEPEREFDSLVALAADLLDCPTALLTLVDRERQWVKARLGSEIAETPRDVAFCDHTIRSDDLLVVSNATDDVRFAENPFVTVESGIRFYAGAPIRAADADGEVHRIGALCVIDGQCRSPSRAQLDALRHLASLAEALIGARSVTRQAVDLAVAAREKEQTLRRQERTFHQAERIAMIGSWRMTLDDERIVWSEGVYRIHEEPIGSDVSLTRGLDYYPPADRARVSAAIAETLESGRPFDFEADFVTAAGAKRRVRSTGELEIENGRAVAMVGVFQDITDRHRLERSLRESASIDEVTRIANRSAFNAALRERLKAVSVTPFALAIIDLDHFKATNDTHGHLAGDSVLRSVGQRLRAPFLKGSFAARLGGDEFALIVTDPGLLSDLNGTIEQLLEFLKTPVQTGDALLGVSASIGTARGKAGLAARDLVHAADAALYDAKRARRGSYRVAA